MAPATPLQQGWGCGAGSPLLPEGLHLHMLPAAWGAACLQRWHGDQFCFSLYTSESHLLSCWCSLPHQRDVEVAGRQQLLGMGGNSWLLPQPPDAGQKGGGAIGEKCLQEGPGPWCLPSSEPICRCLSKAMSAWPPEALMHVGRCQWGLIQLAWAGNCCPNL